MSPHRQLSKSSSRKPSVVQDIFLGLGLLLGPEPAQDPHSPSSTGRDLEYTMILHDGTGVVESETFHFQYHTKGKDEDGLAKEAKSFSIELMRLMRSVQTDKGMNVSQLPPAALLT